MVYRILVLTSDKYVSAIRPLSYLLNFYWPDHPEVVVGGYTPPNFKMPRRFIFHSIGNQEDYPIGRWSDGLIKFIQDVPDEVFMLMLEDMWPVRPVMSDVVTMCYWYMQQFKYVARLDLTGDRLYAGGVKFYGNMGHVDLVWSDPESPYHMSMMPAFWRREHLLRVLVSGESPWDVELIGTPRLSAMRDVIVLGTNAWPYKCTLAFRGGDSGNLLLDELDEEVVENMKKRRLIE